ncbi:nek3, partial [Symbiodinium sp. KB8]
MRRMDASAKRKGTSFAELVFPEGRPCREPHQVEYAQQKVLQLWLGTHSRFAGKRLQARRPWAKKLSQDFPQKLMHYLWRSRQ